jgi:hypothetical protein
MYRALRSFGENQVKLLELKACKAENFTQD